MSVGHTIAMSLEAPFSPEPVLSPIFQAGFIPARNLLSPVVFPINQVLSWSFDGSESALPVRILCMFFTMANVGLPGTSGFVGEFLTLMGIFQVNTWVAAVATTGVILSAAYALWLYRRVIMGPLLKDSLKAISDMTAREKLVMAPLIVMTLLLGIYPSLVTDMIGPSVGALVTHYHAAVPADAVASLASH